MLRVRWLGRVPYHEAHALQTRAARPERRTTTSCSSSIPTSSPSGCGGIRPTSSSTRPSVGADLVRTDRGGDVTYHGPGQVVAYPIVNVPMGRGAIPGHVHAVEQVVIDTLAEFGLSARAAGRVPRGVGRRRRARASEDLCHRRPGQPRSVDARARSERRPRHVLVRPDRPLRARRQGGDVAGRRRASRPRWPTSSTSWPDTAAARWAPDGAVDRQDVDVASVARAGRCAGGRPVDRWPARAAGTGGRLRIRLRQAGVDPDGGLALAERKPPWLRVPARMGDDFLALRHTMRELDLVTVCEEAGCPNIFECWADGTATFMINGERCTRACGFCLVDTRHPLPDRRRRARAGGRGRGATRVSGTRWSPPWPATIWPTEGPAVSWPPSRPSAGGARRRRSRSSSPTARAATRPSTH